MVFSADFSDCGFSRRVFLFRQEFSFFQSYRFFPSFCQALAEDRVTNPTKNTHTHAHTHPAIPQPNTAQTASPWILAAVASHTKTGLPQCRCSTDCFHLHGNKKATDWHWRGMNSSEWQGANGEYISSTASRHQQIHLLQTAPTQRSEHFPT